MNHAFEYDAPLVGLSNLGEVRYCSSAAARVMRWTPSSLLGKSIAEVIPNFPLHDHSPSWNIRYAKYCESRNKWESFDALDEAGMTVLLEVLLKNVTENDRTELLLALRMAFRADDRKSVDAIS